MKRRWIIIAVLLTTVGLVCLELTGRIPTIATREVVLPGGVTLPVAEGALVRSFVGDDSFMGWIYDFQTQRRYRYDALLMAGNYVGSARSLNPDLEVVQGLSAGGVPFSYAVVGERLYVTFEVEYKSFVNFTVPLSEDSEIASILRFLSGVEPTQQETI